MKRSLAEKLMWIGLVILLAASGLVTQWTASGARITALVIGLAIVVVAFVLGESK